MAKGCKKCDPHDICEECPEWIFTLADLIMCMMGLFVILWVLKPSVAPGAAPAQEKEMAKVIEAIREAFGYIPDAGSNKDITKLVEEIRENGPGEKGRTTVTPNGADGTDKEVQTIRPGKIATTGGKLDFDRGSDLLRPATQKELQAISKIIIGHRNIVVVKGHTSLDDLPEGSKPEERMTLSVRRAQAVADYLISIGVAPDCLRVQGCSTFEPVKERAYTEADQQWNRRVEVEAAATLIPELQDKTPTRKSSQE